MASERSSSRFPGAHAALETAAYAVLGAPLDVTTSHRSGTDAGPRAIRNAARGFEDYDRPTDASFSDRAVTDHGDVQPWGDVTESIAYLQGRLETVLDRDDGTDDAVTEGDAVVPLMLGGEHTVSIAGVRALDPDVFVALDAHLDCRAEYAGRELSHATVTRRALETAGRAIVIGARSGSEAGWQYAADRDDVTVVPPDAAADWTPELGVEESVYLSLDVDVLDPGFAPATGTPEPFGLSPATVRDLVTRIAPRAVGCDVVEVTDADTGETAALAAKLLRRFVHDHAAASAGEADASAEARD
jgi:agmatinase